MLRKAQKDLLRAQERGSCGDVGGLKLMPSLVHGAAIGPRQRIVPIVGNRVRLEDYEEYE